MNGTLYVCATPIGNLEDITLRVLRVLGEVDVIAAEDTRHTIKLLNYYEIKTSLTSYHEHNKISKGPQLLQRLQSGENIALVSDAGLPVISDPGGDLISLCIANDIPVTICPGASAGLSALLLSGIDGTRHAFEGFLPHSKKERREILQSLSNERRTMIFYEAPHRLKETLALMLIAFGDRPASIARELTKRHEQVLRDTLSTLNDYYQQNDPRGEFVLIISGATGDVNKENTSPLLALDLAAHAEFYLQQGMSKKDVAKLVAAERGIHKREIYSLIAND